MDKVTERKNQHVQFPKFYIKAVGGKFSIMHRLTHTYLENVESVAELKKQIKYWNGLEEEQLWKFLLFQRSSRIVKPQDFDKVYSYEEDWYKGSWGIYTAQFYKENPKLLVVQEQIPYDLVNKVRMEKYESEQARFKQLQKEREEMSRDLDIRLKEEKVKKVEEPKPLKISDTEGIKKRIIRKKEKKKVRIKKKNQVYGVPIIGDNPFD